MTPAEERPQAPLSFHPLPRFLAETGGNKLLYILKAWLLVFVPSLALSVGLYLLSNEAAGPEFGAPGPLLFFLLVIFAPVVETLLMIPPLLVLNRLLGPRAAIVGSAILWGVLHSLAAASWGLIVWWPFLVLSAILLAWRRSHGLGIAILVVTAVHALQNAVAGSALFLS